MTALDARKPIKNVPDFYGDDGDDYDGDDGGQTGVARLRINNQPSANSFGNLIGIIK